MGGLVIVMVTTHLAVGCAVTNDAVAALMTDGWTPPESQDEIHLKLRYEYCRSWWSIVGWGHASWRQLFS